MLADKAAIKEVSSIYLQAGLIGKDLQLDTCLWTVEACRHYFVVALPMPISIQTPVMIKAHSVFCHIKELVVDVL